MFLCNFNFCYLWYYILKKRFFLFVCWSFGGDLIRGIWRSPGQGSNWSCSRQPTPQPQQHGIRAASATYTTVHGNAGSLTHWAGPGIQPTSSWMLVAFINHWATMGTPPTKKFFKKRKFKDQLKNSLTSLFHNSLKLSINKGMRKQTMVYPWMDIMEGHLTTKRTTDKYGNMHEHQKHSVREDICMHVCTRTRTRTHTHCLTQ